MQVIKKTADRNKRDLGERELAEDFIRDEEKKIRKELVEKRGHDFKAVKKGTTTIGGKKLYFMSYRAARNGVRVDAVLHVYFPENYKKMRAFYVFFASGAYLRGSHKPDLEQIHPLITSFKASDHVTPRRATTGDLLKAVNVDDITITQARYQPQNGQWTISGTCTDPFLPDGVMPTTITVFFGSTIEGSPPVIGTATCVAGDPVGTWSYGGTSDTAPAPDPNVFNYVSAESALQGFYEGFPVTFAGQNNAPVATDDDYTIDEDVVLNGDVLANDIDTDFDPLTVVLVTPPAHGTLDLQPDGGFTYTPDPGYTGPDSFTYVVFDGISYSDPVTVDITVSP